MAKASNKKAALRSAAKVVKEPPKKRAEARQCLICIETKTSRGYQPPGDSEICDHLRSICKACIQKLLKSKITDDNLGVDTLECPFGDCGHQLVFSAVKQMVPRGTFESWDQALLRRCLRDADHLIPCLNPNCGLQFSIEGCNIQGSRGRKKLTCPYCEFDFCVRCNRAWHPKTTCDQITIQARQAEYKLSEEEMERMGARPCPSCGIKIEKVGGCSHMFCTSCKRDFYWDNGKLMTTRVTVGNAEHFGEWQ